MTTSDQVQFLLPATELHTSSTWYSFVVPKGWSEAALTDAMTGAAYAIQSFIPLFVRCEKSDIHVIPQVKAVHTNMPTFFIYDTYPGGIGLSEKIYDRWSTLLQQAAMHVSSCRCKVGCPVCIGAQEAGTGMRSDVESLLHKLAGGNRVSYEKKLMAMKNLLTKSTVKKKTEQKNIIAPPPPYEAKWLAAGLTKEKNIHGIVYKRVVDYALTYQHGDIELSRLQSTVEEWREVGEDHRLKLDFKKRLVFFDTETTGLKGAGTLIFLLGFIEQIEDKFKLTQYVLPGPDHERGFLYASGLWENKLTLVTYNGKSFDVPQLETRWTMNRNTLPPLLRHAHIDLLHGSRRIWKEEISTFRLTNIEEEKLGFFRQDDIPGHMRQLSTKML